MLVSDKKVLVEQVDSALDDVRPHLAVDGGNIEVVDITDDMIVVIRWLGTCESCTMSTMTMKAGVEQAIQSRVPVIKGVKAENGIS